VQKAKLDREQIKRLYEQHGRGLIAYACTFLPGFASAEDVLHQVFARLLRGGIEIAGSPVPYLYRAVRNAALNDLRNRARDVVLDDGWLESPPDMPDAGLVLESALRDLPVEQREVITLRVWGEMTFDEVATTLGIAPKTAESRYRYGLSKLKEVFRPVTKGSI
jgi:RNA polymerase sigma-70 factor (ECF subfamily)